jgi:solute carrier family 25 folate transporter 32
MTNPIWVVKVRMFTTRADSPSSYRGVWGALFYYFLSLAWFVNYRGILDGLASIWRQEGMAGWWKGTSLALVGVSNGAVQFMAYEEMKRWGFEQKQKRYAKAGKEMRPEDDKLVSLSPSPTPHV